VIAKENKKAIHDALSEVETDLGIKKPVDQKKEEPKKDAAKPTDAKKEEPKKDAKTADDKKKIETPA